MSAALSLAEQLADTIPAAPFPKVCSCGRMYSANTWSGLRLCGRMDDGADGELELRDCSCGSTIAIELGPRV